METSHRYYVVEESHRNELVSDPMEADDRGVSQHFWVCSYRQFCWLDCTEVWHNTGLCAHGDLCPSTPCEAERMSIKSCMQCFLFVFYFEHAIKLSMQLIELNST